MTPEDLNFISNKVLEYIIGIEYDKTQVFNGFKLEMLINIKSFLSPDSLEKFEHNKQILDKIEIKETNMSLEIDKYIERLRFEIIEYISTLKKQKESSKEFEINKEEIKYVLFNFLNTKKYHRNIEILKRVEQKQKMLTLLNGRW